MKKIIIFFLFFFPIASFSQTSATQISVVNDTVNVIAFIELNGDPGVVTNEVVAQWQQALNDQYNNKTYLYKCYKVKFNIQAAKAGNYSSQGQAVHQAQIINVTADQETKDSYAENCVYTWYDWEKYDEVNGTEFAEDCGQFYGSYYNVACAERSQWFRDTNNDRDVPCVGGYANINPVGYDGKTQSSNLVVPNETSDNIIAHEVGHTLGFEHAVGISNLMNNDLDIGLEEVMEGTTSIDGTELPLGNLHEMLDKMNLECRWFVKAENLHYSRPTRRVEIPMCEHTCIWQTHDFDAYIDFQVESFDMSLAGKGTIPQSNMKHAGDCQDIITLGADGAFNVVGDLGSESNKGDQNLNLYTLNLKTIYTQKPELQFTFPLYWLSEALANGEKDKFTEFKIQLGNIQDPLQILKPINFSSSRTSEEDCAHWSRILTMPDLTRITKVETFKRNNAPWDNFGEFLESYGIKL